MSERSAPVSYTKGRLRADTKALDRAQQATKSALRVEAWSWSIPFPQNADEPVFENIPYSGTIETSSAKCSSGTATLAIKKNGSSIGNAHSVTGSREVKTHSVAFAVGDNIALGFSSVSSCVRAVITVKVTRDI